MVPFQLLKTQKSPLTTKSYNFANNNNWAFLPHSALHQGSGLWINHRSLKASLAAKLFLEHKVKIHNLSMHLDIKIAKISCDT